jgi:hypothetical protein
MPECKASCPLTTACTGPRPVAGVKKMNNLAQSRQGAMTRKQEPLCSLRGLGEFAPLREIVLVFREEDCMQTTGVERGLTWRRQCTTFITSWCFLPAPLSLPAPYASATRAKPLGPLQGCWRRPEVSDDPGMLLKIKMMSSIHENARGRKARRRDPNMVAALAGPG